MSGSFQRPAAFNPAPIGPNFGQAVADAARMTQLAQIQDEVQKGNALQNIMGRPGAVDAMGQPTPETMRQVMGVDVNAGLKLRQASIGAQQHQLQMDRFKTETFAKQYELTRGVSDEAYTAYKQAVENGLPEPAARAIGQDIKNKGLDRLAEGGVFSKEQQNSWPREFDPAKELAHVQTYEQWSKQKEQEKKDKLAEQRLDETRRRDQLNYERAGVGTGVDVDGRPYFIRPNAPRNEQFVYRDGTIVPDDKLVGSHKMGTSGGPGTPSAMRNDIIKQLRDDPKWANEPPGALAVEAQRQMKAAGQKVGLADDPDALAWAAEFFKRTNQMPFGMGDPEDRRAVIKYLAHEGDDPTAKPGTSAPGTPTAGAPASPGAPGAQPPAPGFDANGQPLPGGVPAKKTPAEKAADAVTSAAGFLADKNSLRRIQVQRDSIAGYERGATKEFDLAVSLAPKTPEPINMQLLTQWVRTGARQFNNVQNGQFYVALTSALDEYAKVISGATGSAAASTDSARAQALSLIPPGASTEYIKGMVKTIKQGMDNRRAGYDEQITEIQGRMRDGGRGTPAATGGAPAAASPTLGAKASDEQKRTLPNVKTREEADALGPGKFFITPGGVIGQVPGKAPAAAGGTDPAQSSTPVPPAPVGAPAGKVQIPPATRPSAPTTEGGAQPKTWAVPAKHADDPDGTTYNGGKYVKQGGRLREAKPEAPADEAASLTRARAAIDQGADPEKVRKMLQDAGIDPAKLDRIQREEVGEGWPARFRTLIGARDDNPEPKVTYGNRLSRYPGKDEVKAARDADFSYGTGNEAFMSGQRQRELPGGARSGERLETVSDPKEGKGATGTPDTGELYTKAQLAVLRSPISAIGYEPRRINLDTKAGDKMNIAGAYDRETDSSYSNAAFESNMVHEATHRGLEKLRKAGVVPKELWDRLPEEESIVRYIMALHMGDPEKDRGKTAEEQRRASLYRFGRDPKDPQKYDSGGGPNAKKYRAALNELTGIAAIYFGSLHPGGPR